MTISAISSWIKTVLVTINSGMVEEDERPGQNATRPDSEGMHVIEPVTAVCPLEQADGKNDTARKRDKPEGVALLDSNQDMTGSKDDGEDDLPQVDIDPGLDEGRGGQEPMRDVSGTAPPGGEKAVQRHL